MRSDKVSRWEEIAVPSDKASRWEEIAVRTNKNGVVLWDEIVVPPGGALLTRNQLDLLADIL